MLQNENIAGNFEKKYASSNPVVKLIMKGFFIAIDDLSFKAHNLNASDFGILSEFGCGEGCLTSHLNSLGISEKIKGFDFSAEVIAEAKKKYSKQNIDFYSKSIYDVAWSDYADFIICCEVLEHLEQPELALKKIKELNPKYCIFSVPNEPVWRILNFSRGKYLTRWGNTPGHVNNWTPTQFRNLISKNFKIIEFRQPFPWSMILAVPVAK